MQYVPEQLHRRGAGDPPPVLHEPRPPGLRARQPARGREGRAVRPLLALAQEPAAPLPRRVRRRPRPHRRPHRRRDHRAASAPRSSTTGCSSSTATTPSPSSAACTSRASRRRTCSPRSSSGAASWPTSSSRRATSRTTAASAAGTATTATAEVLDSPLGARYVADLDALFDTYAAHAARAHRLGARRGTRRSPATPTSSTSRRSRPRRATPPAASCPRRRCRTSASTAPARRFEALLLRMRAHPLPEARSYAAMMLDELRKVIPSFLTRVDRPDRGGAWSEYLAETRASATAELVDRLFAGDEPEPRPAGHPHRLRPRRRGQAPRRDLLPAHAPARGPDPRPGPHASATDERGRAAARVRGGADEPPPQAGPRVRAHRLPLRRRSPTTARSATCSATAC